MQAAPTPVMTPVTITTTYAWDYGNRLLSIASSSLAASFLYDAEGTRMKSILGGVTTKTPTTWYNVSGTTPTKHILMPDGEMLATVEGSNAAATVSYIHTDHLTGSSLITNNTGAQTQLLDYHPFGTLRLNNQSSTFNEKRKFAGHEYDAETGLSYMLARYYNPSTGTFLSEDPAFLAVGDSRTFPSRYGRTLEQHLQNPQALNSYAYALNNPFTYRDPQGEIVPIIAGAIAAVLESWPAIMGALALTATPVGVAMLSQDTETLMSPGASNVAKAMAEVSLIGSMTPMGTVDDMARSAGSITTKIEGQITRAYKSFRDLCKSPCELACL